MLAHGNELHGNRRRTIAACEIQFAVRNSITMPIALI